MTNAGRWPPNVLLIHVPLIDSLTGAVMGDACADGCVRGCPVQELDSQSGERPGSFRTTRNHQGGQLGWRAGNTPGFDDSGGASRYFHGFRWQPEPDWPTPSDGNPYLETGDTMTPVYDRWGIRVFQGDCLSIMRDIPNETVSAIITDPPYGLAELPTKLVVRALTEWVSGNREYVPATGKGFMNAAWDRFVPPPAVWDECLRILKPGGHLLCFAGTRTADLMGISIRLAGFEIRDEIDSIGSRISWINGAGFPKSRDIGKDIDRMAGVEREIIGVTTAGASSLQRVSRVNQGYRANLTHCTPDAIPVTAPATDAAKQWQGWGSAMKPSHEPIIVAQKPFPGTIAANVLKHGTGALNIGACRVEGRPWSPRNAEDITGGNFAGGNGKGRTDRVQEPHADGRWPPNTVFSHSPAVDPATGEVIGDACADGCVPGCAVAELDRQSGERPSSFRTTRNHQGGSLGWVAGNTPGFDDSGGASRFFHCFRWEPKAPSATRPKVNGKQHPTVKPVSLLRWMSKLICPPGGVILDCFAGTGTTGQAARAEGFGCILIEQDPDAIELIRARLDALPKTEAPPVDASVTEPQQGDLFDLLGGSVAQ